MKKPRFGFRVLILSLAFFPAVTHLQSFGGRIVRMDPAQADIGPFRVKNAAKMDAAIQAVMAQAGSLEFGKQEDLVFPSADPRKTNPQQISPIAVAANYISGKYVYSQEGVK